MITLSMPVFFFISPVVQEEPRGSGQPKESDEVRQLRAMIEQLEGRVKRLEAKRCAEKAASVSEATKSSLAADKGLGQSAAVSETDRSLLDFFRGTTINLTIDGYYGYNFNRPVGGINLLCAYDMTSNSFSLNQATLVLERAPDVEAGRRFGARVGERQAHFS